MLRYVATRFFTGVLSLAAVTMLVFGLSRLYGDPLALYVPAEGYGVSQEELAIIEKRLHLDRPFVIQYAYWLKDLLSGDLGTDLEDRRPLAPKLAKRITPTLLLAGIAWLIATVGGIGIGVLSAIRRGSIFDLMGRGFAVVGQGTPTFWVAIMAILVFAVWLGWLPAGTTGLEGISVRHVILPAAILGWVPMAGYARLTRSAMLEVLDSEYIKLARSKGVSRTSVIWKHAFKNAIIPPLTFSGVLLASLITGSIQVETVFAWPGIAQWGVRAVWSNNFNVLVLVTLVFTLAYAVTALLVDLLYAVVDPRIRHG